MLTQVGKYQIVEKIGVGGFGTVYKGRDPFIKRLVAIKTCQSQEEEIRKRFFREAEFAGNLQHKNVTTIYDFGVTEDGTPYIVQEFLTGEDLDKLIKKRFPLTLRQRLRILLDICEGLGYAHQNGIIHRDIKPSNVRILEDESVKIMDFGIAKSLVSQSTLTQTGITLGTASYLAPEQIRGEELDPRTDIFSLGVLAYELLTAQKPFAGDHISTVLYKIMNETPARPSEIDPDVPQALDLIVMKALEKDRTRRYGSCAEMKAGLNGVADELPEGARTSPTRGVEVEGDLDRTRPTPSSGFPQIAVPAPPAGVTPAPPSLSSAPLDPSARRPAAVAGSSTSVAEVRLREGTSSAPISTPGAEGGGALKIFLGAAVLLVLVAAGVGWYFLQGPGSSREASAVRSPESPTSGSAPSTAPAAPATLPATTLPASPAPAAPPTAAPTVVPTPVPTPTPRAAPAFVSVTFASNTNARLTVDGRKYDGLPSPIRVTLKPGRYTAVFDVPDYLRKEQTFEVRAGVPGPTVRADFAPRGILQVAVAPEAQGAEVTIDGRPAGRAPLRKTLAAGPHTLQASLAGFEPVQETVTVPEDDIARVTLAFRRKEGTPQ